MITKVKHIVSQVKWDLSFNEKEEVNTLQNKLSAWSKSQMLAELESIFNEVCPNEETWQIESLEINLGQITYENLNQELPQKFREALLNKLKDSVFRGYIDGKPIKIFENSDSHLMLLKNYLELGYMPWNYSGSISINSLLLEQMAQNKDELVEIIRELGQFKQVRKRIAWQFNDVAIQKIIKGIEPNNHEEIVDFTNKITAIQEKESIVQSASSDFKKNLWFWVLNYLFEERGTLFNRLHFMESSIRQMAKHYNLSFEDLFQEIESTVTEIIKKTALKGGFVQTLNLLSVSLKKESESQANKPLDNQFYLNELSKLIKDPEKRNHPKQIIKINELVEQLYNRDRAGLKALILKVGSKVQQWKLILVDLNEYARTCILKTLQPNQFKFIFETSHFFKEIGYLESISGLNAWNATSMQFLIQNANSTFSRDDYLAHQLSKTNFAYTRSSKQGSIYKIAQVLSGDFSKREIRLETYITIRENVDRHLLNKTEYSIIDQIKHLLKQITKALNEGRNYAAIESHQPAFEQLCLRYPNELIIELSNQIKKSDIEVFTIHYIDRKNLHFLINKQDNKNSSLLISVYQIISDIPKSYMQLLAFERDEFARRGFIELLKTPTIGFTKYTKLLGVILLNILRNRSISDRSAVLISLIESRKMDHYEQLRRIFIVELEHIEKQETYATFNDLLLADKENRLSQLALKKWLQKEIENNPDSVTKARTNAEKKMLVSFIIPDGGRLLKQFLIKFKVQLFKNQEIKLEQPEYVFWKCLIDYNAHKDDARRFKNLLEASLSHYLLVHSKGYLESFTKPEQPPNGLQTKTDIIRTYLHGQDQAINQSQAFIESLEELLYTNPSVLKKLFIEIETKQDLAIKLNGNVDFEFFMTRIFEGPSNINAEIHASFLLIRALISIEADASFRTALELEIWKDIILLCENPNQAKELILARLQAVFRSLALKSDINANRIASILDKVRTPLPNYVKTYFTNMNAGFKRVLNQSTRLVQTKKQKIVKKAVESKEISSVLESIFFQNKVPYWFGDEEMLNNSEILNIMLESHEFAFYKVLKTNAITDPILFRLHHQIPFDKLVSAIEMTHPNQIKTLRALQQLYAVFGQSSFTSITALDLQNLLFKKIIRAWKTNNWRLIAPQQIWSELIWESQIKYGIRKVDLIKDLVSIKEQIPTTYQFALNAIVEQNQARKFKSGVEAKLLIDLNKKTNNNNTLEKPKMIKDGITISNAGIVLINSYISMLFERLGLMKNGQFNSREEQERAVNYLQYVVNGIAINEEHHLVLNKVLCGLHPSNPVKSELNITDAEIELIDGMIEAIINYWPAIGKCTSNGFRGNWLIRDGILTEYEDKWILNVEKRAYDILINKSPFSFSLIKQKWMDKPIHVEWAY